MIVRLDDMAGNNDDEKLAAALELLGPARKHEVTHHSVTAMGMEPRYAMTCICGWALSPAPKSLLERNEIEDEHRRAT